jgi:hypothetical protein
MADYRQDGDAIWALFSGKKEGTLWYYRALSDEYQQRDPNRISRELAIVLGELERLVGKKRRPTKVSASRSAKESARKKAVASSGR